MWPIARSLTVCGLCFALPTASDRSRESGDKGVEKEWDRGQSGQAGGCMPLTASEINARTHTHTQSQRNLWQHKWQQLSPLWQAKTLPQGAATLSAVATLARISINKRNDNNVSTRKYNKPLSGIKN